MIDIAAIVKCNGQDCTSTVKVTWEKVSDLGQGDLLCGLRALASTWGWTAVASDGSTLDFCSTECRQRPAQPEPEPEEADD